MNAQHYEVIDSLDRTISHISRNEKIDRAQVLKILQERLTYQQRRIENFLSIGWVNNCQSIEPESAKY
jgi:hypothetical protein